MYNPDNTLSDELMLALLITTVIILYASYLYAVRFRETGEKNLIFLIDGSIIIIVSNFVYFLCEFSGHFLIIAGFVFIHLAMYKSSVEHPYEKLAIAEEKLRFAAEERYKNLFDSANDAVVTIDLEDKVTAWNKAAEKIFGWKAEEVMGKKLCSLIVPKELQAEREQLINRALSGVPVMWIESVRLRRDGGKIDVSLTISPILDAGGQVAGFSGIIRDITERKRAEEMRLEIGRLEAATRAKSEILAHMSHELRTPLNAIIGFSELMKQNVAGEISEKHKRYAENILASAHHLLNLINDVLDMSKVEAGRIELVVERFSIPEAINEGLILVKEEALKRKIIIKREFDPGLQFIEADKLRFKQILFNLLSNAVKFSKPKGGTITVSTKKEGDMAKISVSDTGIGIKQEAMGKLFREFQQIDAGIARKYGGTGLGLAISKKLVELHGGKIWAESKYDEGSTFTFSLPLVASSR
jgi:protein-histidine pros-kinase